MTLELAVRAPLDRFELQVELSAGRPVTGIFGPSGAGKTSLLEIVAGLRRGARGCVRLDGESWLDSEAGRFVPPERRHVGYVPQESLLFPHLDVRGNLLAGAARARRNRAATAALLGRVCDLLELGPLVDRSVTTLSGGERRRVALGRALCSGPRLLLLDEPLASLDLPLRRRLLPFLRRLRAELTIPMLVVSHDPLEMLALCDEIAALDAGRVVARGEPHRVLTDPELFPLAATGGFENVLPGQVVRCESGVTVVRLAAGDDGLEVVALGAGGEPGEDLLLGLPSSDAVLATERPTGLSARNALPARVSEIRQTGDRTLVTVALSEELPPLAVEVTRATPAALGLEPGTAVHVVFKAASCRLYGGRRRPAS